METDFRSRVDHMWHVWINRRQDERRKAGDDVWEHDLYEFKNMLQFLEYGHEVIAKAFEGRLAKTHRQCSRQEPVEIKENTLKCCLEAQDGTTCPILLSLKSVFDEHAQRPPIGDYSYVVHVEYLYRTMAKTCAWHIYQNSSQCDTSEGYLLDESDRMFWRNVYDSMMGDDVVEEE